MARFKLGDKVVVKGQVLEHEAVPARTQEAVIMSAVGEVYAGWKDMPDKVEVFFSELQHFDYFDPDDLALAHNANKRQLNQAKARRLARQMAAAILQQALDEGAALTMENDHDAELLESALRRLIFMIENPKVSADH